jgi:hypothetical protein
MHRFNSATLALGLVAAAGIAVALGVLLPLLRTLRCAVAAASGAGC